MKKQKSIENLEKKNLGNFVKTYGAKIIGGNRTMTIKEVVVTPKKKKSSLESGDGDLTVDGNNDGDSPSNGPWY